MYTRESRADKFSVYFLRNKGFYEHNFIYLSSKGWRASHIFLFAFESIKYPSGNNNQSLEILYKCNFRAWNNTSKCSVRSKCIFSFLHQTQKLVFGSILNSRTSNYSLKKCIIYIFFISLTKAVKTLGGMWLMEMEKLCMFGIGGVTRITHRTMLLPAVSQSPPWRRSMKMKTRVQASLPMRFTSFFFWTNSTKEEKLIEVNWLWKVFIIKKKSICWHIYSTYCRRERRAMALFWIKNRCSTRRWVA